MIRSFNQLSLTANIAFLRAVAERPCMWSTGTGVTTGFNKPYHQRPKESLL